MHVKEKIKEGVAVYYISGEISIDTIPEIKKQLKKSIPKKTRKVLLNFKEVTYIDSSGLAYLIDISKDLKNIQGVLFLSNLPTNVMSVFGITRLEKTFKIYEAEEEALRDFYGY